jgi:hypothetical protein
LLYSYCFKSKKKGSPASSEKGKKISFTVLRPTIESSSKEAKDRRNSKGYLIYASFIVNRFERKG